MAKKLEEIIIPKEEAIFWLDKQGKWHIGSGEFKNKKIIDYFHSCIEKDKNGYYVTQTYDNKKEKVYFHYEDTALFVFDVIEKNGLISVLNTKKKVKIKPKKLFLENENLYLSIGKEKAKFVDNGLVKLSKFLEYDDKFWIKIKKKRYPIREF